MPRLSNPYLRWLTALNLVSILIATGCNGGSKTKVETGTSSAQAESNAIQGEDVPARVVAGSMAPDFELPSTTGGMVSLSTLLKESAVALVFYRSAVW